MISTDGLPQKQQYVHGWKYNVIATQSSIVPTILYEFHSSKGHQETIHTFETIRFYWWPKLHQDIVKYINKYDVC